MAVSIVQGGEMRSMQVKRRLVILALILLTSFPLVSCDAISTLVDRIGKAETPTARPVETSSLPILERELSQYPFSLISDRLTVQMPVGAEDEAMQADAMSAQAPSKAETKLVLEADGKQLVLYAQETFYTTDDLEKDLDTILKLRYGQGFTYTAEAVKQSGGGMKVIGFSPAQLDKSANSVLIQGAVVGIDDGAIVTIGVYATPETTADEDLCRKQAERILSSIEPGSRKIVGKPHEERLGLNSLTIQLDKNYVVAQHEGQDFSVFYLMKYVKLGEPAPSIGIYIGAHPSMMYPQRGIQESQLAKTEGKLLKKSVEWLSYEPNDGGYSAETYLYLNDTLIMHIFVDAADETEFETIRKMIQTLKIK